MEISSNIIENFPRKTVKRGEVYYVGTKTEFDGAVQSFGRPFLVVSNNVGNQNSNICVCVPLTSKAKKPLPTHTSIIMNGTRSTILCEQFVTINQHDFCQEPVDILSNEAMLEIDKALAISLANERQSSMSNKLLERYYNELERQLKEQKFLYDSENYLTKIKIVKVPVIEKLKINEYIGEDSNNNYINEINELKQEVAKIKAERDIYKNMSDILMTKIMGFSANT